MKSRDRARPSSFHHTPAAAVPATHRGSILRPVAASIRSAAFATGSLAVLGLTPLGALALGLGELTVESRLGAPFSASTVIRAGADETVEPGCVSVKAAPADSGIPGIPRARVALEPRDGGYLLRVRTQRAVLEPVVAFVLAADCPGAAPVRREYTLLLDPPASVWAGRLPAQAAPSRAEPAPPRARTAPPAATGAADTATSRTPARTRPRAAPTEATVSGARTVRVQRSDTLYGIVSRLYPEANRPERWRVVETVVAANPDVFPQGDANRLPLGASIRVPDALPAVAAAGERARNESPTVSPPGEATPGGGLRILSAEEEDGVGPQGSPLAASTRKDAAPAKGTVPLPAGESPARAPLAPTAEAAPAETGLAARQAEAGASQGASIAELNEQLTSAQTRIRELTEKVAQLDAQVTETRAAAVSVPTAAPTPPPPPPPANPGTAQTGFDASSWYPLGLLAIAGVPLAYLLGRSGRRRPETSDEAFPIPAMTAGGVRTRSRAAAAPTLGHGEPSSIRRATRSQEPSSKRQATPSPEPTSRLSVPDALPVASAGAAAPPADAAPPTTPSAVATDDGQGPVHRLLLEAELHLLFDQREEARYVLDQAVGMDDAARPDLRPWTMLFDLLRAMGDRDTFERQGNRFQQRYNVSAPRWDRAPQAGDGLAGRFPHVMDRIVELWGTREGLRMLNALLLDDRGGNRKGFDFEIGEEIGFLRDLLDRRGLDPVSSPAGDDRWATTTLNLAQ